ncbi:MAG: selenide, water dikinase SelD [Gemmatimonadales bacterium]|nr:selenide, water dikinase SelD [Gemmatimonadales bacterium]
MLRHVPAIGDPRILVDASTRDDAAVYRLSDTRALVATVDFFTPIVDDARTWGRIAAANALSDLYAMGATPMCALSLVGWPRETLPLALLGEVLDGMGEITLAAGCPIVGGHSIDAVEPHVGLVALGEAHPDRLLTNAGARAGDQLVLTKPLGTGILTTALKRDLLAEPDLAAAVHSMTTLNATAMAAALAHGVTAATDVTGFGLLGHLGNILGGSGVGAELWLDRVPLLPRAREFAAAGVAPGGTRRNLAAATGVFFAPEIGETDQLLLADAQTSGGLLLAVPPERVAGLVAALAAAGTLARAEIGVLTSDAGTTRVLRRRG